MFYISLLINLWNRNSLNHSNLELSNLNLSLNGQHLIQCSQCGPKIRQSWIIMYIPEPKKKVTRYSQERAAWWTDPGMRINWHKWRYCAKKSPVSSYWIRRRKMLTELTRIKTIVIRWFHKGNPRWPLIIRVLHHGRKWEAMAPLNVLD